MLNNKNRVAILMATYNSEVYLKAQIDSILEQTYTDWALYIRDDGSQDNTITIIKSYQNECDKIYLLENNSKQLGPRDSFLELLNLVESEYYMFSDHDDVWLNNKIERFVREIDEYISSDALKPVIVCSDLKVVDSNLNELNHSFWDFSNFRLNEFNDIEYHWFNNNINGCSMLLNNAVKRLVFPYPMSAYMHDSWIALVTLYNDGVVLPIQESLMLYRQHDKNTLGAKEVSFSHYFTDIKGVLIRTYNQYRTVNYIAQVSLLKFLCVKVMRRIKENICV